MATARLLVPPAPVPRAWPRSVPRAHGLLLVIGQIRVVDADLDTIKLEAKHCPDGSRPALVMMGCQIYFAGEK